MASFAEYRVIHHPHVAVRRSPSVTSEAVGRKQNGDIVRATRVMGDWIELEGGQGWMLIDGSQVKLGILLEEFSNSRPYSPAPLKAPRETGVREYRVVHKPKCAVRKRST